MTPYRHTQYSILNLVLLGIPVVLCGYLFVAIESPPANWICLGGALLFVLLVFLFHSLTIEVDSETVRLHFGTGIIRKSWPIADCTSACHVRTALWEGWGIRLTSRGWLYNVSIPDAIMIRLADGTAVQLGSDEPGALLDALERAGVPKASTN